jgi:DHA2 family multidrug resistance protein
MVRQLGGSFGIAITNTYVTQRVAAHRIDMLSHLSPYDPAAVARIGGIEQSLASTGAAPVDAHQMAMKALEYTVTAQSYHLAYMDAFKLIAILFAVCLPLLLFIRVDKKEKADVSSAH